jgi:hypothetical protein
VVDQPTLVDEIRSFFDRFVEQFGTFEGERIASLYLVPGIAIRADASVDILSSRSQIEEFFQATVDDYHREGCRACRYTDLEVVGIGRRCALGTVTWELVREDQTIVKQWRQSYNLVRIERDWLVYASTAHLQPALQGAFAR